MRKVKNYTTEISALKSVAEIEEMLQEIGVTDIMKRCDPATKQVTELRFILHLENNPVPFRLTAHVSEVARRLAEMYNAEHTRTRKNAGAFMIQAYRVVWRNWRDFVDNQIDMILTGNVQKVQGLLPFLMVSDSQTVYDRYAEGGLKMLEVSR